jgi:predicted amidophosphoribosyltransferase
MAQYLTVQAQMRSSDFAGLNLVKAIKGEPFVGSHSLIPLRKTWRRLDKANIHQAAEWYAAWAHDLILAQNFQYSITLVPIPNKSGTIFDKSFKFPTALLAEQIAASFGQGVFHFPALRWKKVLPKAHAGGGTRDPSQMYPDLAFIAPPPQYPKNVVLIDDVCTSGASVKASAAVLRDHNYKPVLALAAGKTCQEQLPDPFAVPDTRLDDYVPWDF